MKVHHALFTKTPYVRQAVELLSTRPFEDVHNELDAPNSVHYRNHLQTLSDVGVLRPVAPDVVRGVGK